MNDPLRNEEVDEFMSIFGRIPPGVYAWESVRGEYEQLIRDAIATRVMPQGLLDRYDYYERKHAASKRGLIID